MEVGKSYTRRYYEDMMERFEAEAKFIAKKEEFEKRQMEITMELKESYSKSHISSQQFYMLLRRLEQVKYDGEKRRFSKDELKAFTENSKRKKGDDGLSDKQDKNIDMVTEKDMYTKEKGL